MFSKADPNEFLTIESADLISAHPLDAGCEVKAQSKADDRATFTDAIFKGLSIGLVISACTVNPAFLGLGLAGKAVMALGGAAISKIGEARKQREDSAKRQIAYLAAVRKLERFQTVEAIAHSKNEEIRAALPYAKPGTRTHDDRVEAIAGAVEALAEIVKEIRQSPAPAIPNPATLSAAVEAVRTALAALLGSPFISRAFFGGQRSGKSYLMAVGSQQMSSQFGTKVYHINLLSYGDEDARYWTHCQESVRCDLAKISDPVVAGEYIEQAIDLTEEFFNQTNALLIVDEFSFTGSKSTIHYEALKPLLASLANKIIALASAGAKRRLAIWTAAPEFTASSVDDYAKAIKKIPVVFVGISPGRTFDWQGQKFQFDKGLFETLKQNWKELSNVSVPEPIEDERIVYLGGEWLPMGQLPPLMSANNIPDSSPKEVEDDKLMTFSLNAQIERLGLTEFRPDINESGRYSEFIDALIDYLTNKDWMTPYAIRQGNRKIKGMTSGTEEVRLFLERAITDGIVIADGMGQYKLGDAK